MKNIALITLNKPGLEAAQHTVKDLLLINKNFDVKIFHKNIEESIDEIWANSDAIIWFTATGIVVRKIARLLESKTKDPAILVMNLSRTQVIPLLSGHIGGANELAQKLIDVIPGLVSFITTATDSMDVFAFDTFAKKQGFDIVNIHKLPAVSNALVNKEPIVIISPFNENTEHLHIKIKPIFLGIGLNRGTTFEELKSDVLDFTKKHNISIENIGKIASFEAKKDEEALNSLAKDLNIELVFFNESDINSLNMEFSPSQAEKHFNIKGVAEPTAVLASRFKTLFIKKNVYKNTTIAAAF